MELVQCTVCLLMPQHLLVPIILHGERLHEFCLTVLLDTVMAARNWS